MSAIWAEFSFWRLLPFTGFDPDEPPAPFWLWLLASTVLDLAVAGALLFRPLPGWFGRRYGPPADLRRAALTFLALTVLFAGKVVVFDACEWTRFGLVALAWYDVVVVTPVCGLLVLRRARRDSAVPRATRRVAALTLLLPVLAFYATQVEPYRLVIERATVPVDGKRRGPAPLTIAVLSDLQTDRIGPHERHAVDALLAERPDLILLPGDLFQGSEVLFERCREDFRALLAHLDAPGGVYLVPGDIDDPDEFEALLPGTRVQLLDNRIARTEVRGRKVTIGGLSTWWSDRVQADLVEQLESDPAEDDLRILLAHHGSVVRGRTPPARIDLIVSGHTHGGQVVVPWLGPPITLSTLPRAVAAGGLHQLRGHWLYVSRGVGHERSNAPRIRFLCPPEVAVLELP